MIVLGLFLSFFQIGLFAFGGGLATIPFMETLGESTGWFSSTDIMNMIAISEATPGPLGINMATFVGYISDSFIGSIASVIGILAPSIIVILCICKIYDKYKDNKYVRKLFYGLRASSISLIFLAFFSAFKITCLDLNKFKGFYSILDTIKIIPFSIAVLLFVLIKKFKLHPIFYISISAIIGIILGL